MCTLRRRWILFISILQLLTVPSYSNENIDSSPISSSTNHARLDESGHTPFISTSSSATEEDESANAIWNDEKRVSKTAHRALSLHPEPVGRWCLDCICQASSGCEALGCEDGFCGPYKISREYWIDAGQPGNYVRGDPRAFAACGVNKTCSELAIQNYMTLFGRDCTADGHIDCWDFARIHLAGPANCRANWIEKTPFWDKFIECQEELEAVRPANNGQPATSSAFVRPLQTGSSTTSPFMTAGGVGSGSISSTHPQVGGEPASIGPEESHVAVKENEEDPVGRSCLDCLFQVLSDCDPSKCSNWKINDPYQISLAYWTDAGRPWSKHQRNSDFHACARNKSCAEQTVQNYMRKFGRDCNQDGQIDCLDFARIHKAGPFACDALWMESHNFLARIKRCWNKWTLPPTENFIQHGVANTVSSDIRSTQKPVQTWQNHWVKAPLIVTADPTVHKDVIPTHEIETQLPFTHFQQQNWKETVIPFIFWRASEASSSHQWTTTPSIVHSEITSGRPNSKHPDEIVVSSEPVSVRVTHRLPAEQVPRLVDFSCLRCLCEASSGCEERVCAFGLCGPYQLSQEYWTNADMVGSLQPGEVQEAFVTCASNKTCSESVIQFYMSKFQRDCDQSGHIDCLDFARLHLAGADQCHARWVDRSTAWAKFARCQSRIADKLITTLAPVEQSEGQGQIPPGRRKPPFIIVPPESERIKSAASERQDVTVAIFEAPDGAILPFDNDDALLTATKPPPFRPNTVPNIPPQGFVQPVNSHRPEFQGPEVRPSQQFPKLPLEPNNPQGDVLRTHNVDVKQLLDQKCFNCLCQATTNCSKDLGCVVTGPEQYFCGPYHISWAYWADSGKPGDTGDSLAFERCLVDPVCAERSVLGYMTKFQRDCNKDAVIDCADFAIIHKTGPTDCQSDWVYNTPYWKRFAQCWGETELDFRSVSKPDLGK